MRKIKLSKLARRMIIGLPLVGVVTLTLLPVSVLARQILIGISMIWLQVFILFEAFSVEKKV